MLAAAIFAVAEVLAFTLFVQQAGEYDLKQIALTGTFFFQSLLTLLAGTLMLGGVVGLYVRQSQASGKAGLIGFFLAFSGTAFVVGDFYANTFVTPLVARAAPAFLDNPLSGFLQVWLPFDFVLLSLSWLLLAAATVRARVYPRVASWSLLVGALVGLVPLPLANLLFEAGLAWLGLFLLKTRGETSGRRRRSKPRH